jgi:hypothetical protein
MSAELGGQMKRNRRKPITKKKRNDEPIIAQTEQGETG